MPNETEVAPAEALFEMAFGARNTQALYVVAKLGIADHLVDGPVDSETLAKKLGVHAPSLFRVLRTLAARGVFTQDYSNRFGLTPFSQLLRSDIENSLRYVAISHGEEGYRASGDLIHTVRTGETAFNHVFGKGHFDYLGEHEEASRTFNMFMVQSTQRSGNIMEAYDFKGNNLLVDVGGGQGALISQVLRSNPQLRGILYDLPQGLTMAPGYLESKGVSDRCKIIEGSFLESVPSGGDVYLLSRILHDWPDEKASLILRNCRKAIRQNGTLLIRESVIPEGDSPSPGKQVDLTMLIMLGGKERTESEWKQLLLDSKFAIKRIVRLGQPFDLIEANPV